MRLHAIAATFAAALISTTTLAATPAGALGRLGPDSVQALRSNLASTHSAALAALNTKIAALQQELAGANTGASVLSGQSAASAFAAPTLSAQHVPSHQAELKQLREQVLHEVDELQSQVDAVNGPAKTTHLTTTRAQIERRFDQLDEALAAVQRAGGPAKQAAARESLRALLQTLQAPGEAIPQGPVPTLNRIRELRRPPGTGTASQVLPRYAMDTVRSPEFQASLAEAFDRKQQGFGYVKASVTLPPVAADTATDCSAVAADLADDGVEVTLTADIRALAQTLQYSPVRILRWMQTEVKFEPYWGSLKGASGVMQTRAGNATDQSSLLIALLRASNIPARFVRGTVAVYDPAPDDSPTSSLQRWLGTKNYSGSAAYLTSGGISAGNFTINGVVQGATFDHVWVQACVPFASYRGTLADAGGYRWVPLDPSIKDHDYQAGMSVNVALDASFYASYLAGRTNQLPPDYLADKTETAARSIRSDASIEDVPYRGRPRALRLDVLPSIPPFEVRKFVNWPGTSLPESATIPVAHRHRLDVSVKNAAGTVLVSTSLNLPQKAFSKLTLSYTPDAASQALWNAWGGSLSSLPAGSVNVIPRLTVDGVVVASGTAANALPLAAAHTMIAKIVNGEEVDGQCIGDTGTGSVDPDITCLNKTVYPALKAGGYYAIGFDATQLSDAGLDARAAVLANNLRTYPTAPTPASGTAYEATTGELLNLVLQTYIHEVANADKRIAEIRGYRSRVGYAIGLTGADLKVDYAFDLPLSVKPAGVYIDFKGGIYGYAKQQSAAPTLPNAGETVPDFSVRRKGVLATEELEPAKLTIYAGSALEHRVWQEALRTDAVSTVRGLQLASEQGVALVTLTASNIAQYDTLMQASMAPYKAGIQAEVAAGGTVTAPASTINYFDPVDGTKAWRGAIYMVENPGKHSYSALINGAISGGFPLLNSTPTTSIYSPTGNTPSFKDLANNGADRPLSLPPGQQGSNPKGSFFGDPVNMLTGHFTHNENDFQIKGRGGFPIVFERWYNSGNPVDGPLGYGWTHSFNHQLKLYGVESGAAKVGWVNSSGGESYFATATHVNGDITRGTTLNNSPGIRACQNFCV